MRAFFITLFSFLFLVSCAHRPKVALVLGGGGAKGAAEVGVLKYIEKSGVPIDMVVGTSIGSIVGGLYSVGYRADKLDKLFRSQEWTDLLTDRVSDYRKNPVRIEDGTVYVFGVPIHTKKDGFVGGFGAVKGDSIVTYLTRMTGKADSISFQSLPIPYACVAVDVKTMSEVVLTEGKLPLAMRASMAIPLLFKPVHFGDKVLVDGGVLNNLPVDVARSMGADYVIAVDLTQKKHEDHEDYNLPDFIEKIHWLQWLINRPDRTRYNHNVASADVYINPQLDDCGVMSFDKVDQMIAAGESAGKKSYKQLVKLRKKVKR